MSKKYDLSSKSDMKRFERDLQKQAVDIAQQKAMDMQHFVNCPHCGSIISKNAGFSICPLCHKQINLIIDIK